MFSKSVKILFHCQTATTLAGVENCKLFYSNVGFKYLNPILCSFLLDLARTHPIVDDYAKKLEHIFKG
jgi:hypothetical protein